MNILITGAWQSANEHIEEIEALGHKICFMQWENDKLPCEYDWVEGIIGNGIFKNHPIDKFSNLKFIQLTSAGYDRVPMDYVAEKNIEIHNASDVYSIPMAEHAISCVLQIYRDVKGFYKKQRDHNWDKKRDLKELFGKHVLIVGCGSVGRECAKRFKAFGCSVTGIATSSRTEECFDGIYGVGSLDDFVPEADVIVLCVPLKPETKGLINEYRLSLMKSDAILINIARGGIIDEKALIKNLDKIGGVALDVFEGEPLATDSPLWDKENVIVTPHNSFVGDGDGMRLSKVIINNIRGV